MQDLAVLGGVLVPPAGHLLRGEGRERRDSGRRLQSECHPEEQDSDSRPEYPAIRW